MPTDNLITVAEAAELVGVGVVSVYKRIDAKKLTKTIKFGLILVSRPECYRWKRERDREARAILAK
jgi:predicted DNA-binding transcriptional regulator AlpA